MIKINLICVGNVKQKFFKEACEEYEKRLKRFCTLDIIEIDEPTISDKPSKAEIDKQLDKLAENITRLIKGEVITLAIEGKKTASKAFAEIIAEKVNEGKEVTFIIGGSNGIPQSVKSKAKLSISFSDMTFPHTLFRVMFLEQLYRAFSINNGSAYHK